MHGTVGHIERKTQQRVVKLLREQLGYAYLRDWTDREPSPFPTKQYKRS